MFKDRPEDDVEEIDFVPDQWDDAEQYPWDCDLSTGWEPLGAQDD